MLNAVNIRDLYGVEVSTKVSDLDPFVCALGVPDAVEAKRSLSEINENNETNENINDFSYVSSFSLFS